MIEQYVNRITQGNCIELLRTLPDNCVDITFADPPFNLRKKYNSSKDNLAISEYLAWCEIWIKEMVRVTKPTGSIFIHNIPKWLTYFSTILNQVAHFKHWIAWDAPTSPMGKSLQPSHYGILFYAKDPSQQKFYEIRYPHKRNRTDGYLQKDYGGKKDLLHPFGPLVSDVWTDIHRIKHNKYRDEHPCQLPVHLLERIVLMSTDENDIVLDPFSGTGTTALAAKRLGRQYIGFELDPEYVEISEGKLKQEEPNSRIGRIWVSAFINEVTTIRDVDWQELANSYILPKNSRDIDHTPIILKGTKPISYIPKNGNGKTDVLMRTLFDQSSSLEYQATRKALTKKTSSKQRK